MLIHLKCPQCGAPVEIEENREVVFCEYCGSKMLNTYKKPTPPKASTAVNPPVYNNTQAPPAQKQRTVYVEAPGRKRHSKEKRAKIGNIAAMLVMVLWGLIIMSAIKAGSASAAASSSLPGSAVPQGPLVFTESQVVERGPNNVYIRRGDDFYLVAEQQNFGSNGNLLYYCDGTANPPPLVEVQPGDELVIMYRDRYITSRDIYGPYIDTGAYTVGVKISKDGLDNLKQMNNQTNILMGDAEKVFAEKELKNNISKIQNDELFTINGAPFGPDTLVVPNPDAYSPDGYLRQEYGQTVAFEFAIGTQFYQRNIKADVKVYQYLDYDAHHNKIDLAKDKNGYSITTGFAGAETAPGIYYFEMNNNFYFYQVASSPAADASSLPGSSLPADSGAGSASGTAAA